MKKLLLTFIITIAAYAGYAQHYSLLSEASAAGAAQTDLALTNAFNSHASNIQVQGQGIVIKILSDDNDGSRHQRFITRLGSGQTILIAHNIDLAPRLSSLREGDAVEFNGVYEWNSKGGMVHWTHLDPANRHSSGWLKHNGQTFQ